MLDNIPFTFKIKNDIINANFFVNKNGKKYKKNDIIEFLKVTFPRELYNKHFKLCDKDFYPTFYSYVFSDEKIEYKIYTELHKFSNIIENGEMFFKIFDCKTSNLIRKYNFIELVDSIDEIDLDIFFNAKTFQEYFKSMVEITHNILVNRILL